MKCRFISDWDSQCVKTGRLCPGICKEHEPKRKFKAFGYEVTVGFAHTRPQTFHWRGLTENGARRKGMLKSCAERIISVVPITEEEWMRAYGLGKM